jgi:hypothetical protein
MRDLHHMCIAPLQSPELIADSIAFADRYQIQVSMLLEVSALTSQVLVRFAPLVTAILILVRVNRLLRVRVIAVAIFALLFAQWNVAAYACPSPAPAPQTAEMTDCAGTMSQLDEASPNLCAEHCHYGEQGDQPRTPAAPAVSLVGLYTVPVISALAEPIWRGIASSDLLTARPPPHTILHCCFRI